MPATAGDCGHILSCGNPRSAGPSIQEKYQARIAEREAQRNELLIKANQRAQANAALAKDTGAVPRAGFVSEDVPSSDAGEAGAPPSSSW